MKGNFAAIVLVVIGAVILLRNLGMLNFNFMEVMGVWRPMVLIALGVGLFLMPRTAPLAATNAEPIPN